jgi:hypothetical protein
MWILYVYSFSPSSFPKSAGLNQKHKQFKAENFKSEITQNTLILTSDLQMIELVVLNKFF